MNAGNLLEVAQALHSKYPKLRLILASDDDAFTDGNPGITKATEAARAVGGYLTKPDFGEQRGDKDTDFNDLHQRAGLGAVQACFDVAMAVVADPVFPPLEDVAHGIDIDPATTAPEPLRALFTKWSKHQWRCAASLCWPLPVWPRKRILMCNCHGDSASRYLPADRGRVWRAQERG